MAKLAIFNACFSYDVTVEHMQPWCRL